MEYVQDSFGYFFSKQGKISALKKLKLNGEKMEIYETIRQQIAENPVLLYMKGSPDQPQCGFSAQVTQVLMACGERFAYIDILSNPEIRSHLPEVSEWPTFPQLFISGELVGGCDIVVEMHEAGELESIIKAAVPAKDT